MFVTFLRFADNRSAAPEFMAVHNDWIARGFTDGVFLCVGSLQPAVGGAIIAHAESRDDARLSRSRRWRDPQDEVAWRIIRRYHSLSRQTCAKQGWVATIVKVGMVVSRASYISGESREPFTLDRSHARSAWRW